MKLPDVYWQMIATLLILSLTAPFGIFQDGIQTLLQLAAAVATAGVLDYLIKGYKKKRYEFPKSAVITGLFVGSLLNNGTAWYIAVFASATAILLKHLIVFDGRNVFNPAALGLVVTGALFHAGDAWWSASNAALVLVLGVLIAYRIKRFQTVLAYLAVYFGLTFIAMSFSIGSLVAGIQNALILFFAFFMLTEHKTTPYNNKGRILYGALVGLFSFLFFYLAPSYFLLYALLLGNLVGVLINRYVR